MNNIERPAEELFNLSVYRSRVNEWLSTADVETGERETRLNMLENLRRQIEASEEFKHTFRRYKAYYLLIPNEPIPATAIETDFPGELSVLSFIEKNIS